MAITSEIQKCLILFADIMDSSRYSSVLGIKQYCDNVLKFQRIFSSIARTYFSSAITSDHFCDIRIHGDEGAVFLVAPEEKADDLVYKAIQFSYELKARMELEFYEVKKTDIVAQKMDVGIGIHYGEVALVIERDGEHVVGLPAKLKAVSKVEGYSINYAKRVESSSRIGKFSNIFLSKECADLVKNKAIILKTYDASLKGISSNDDVAEVRGAFFSEIPLDKDSIDYGKFLDHYTSDVQKLNLIRKPWLKSLVVSVMDSANRSASFNSEAQRIWNRQVEFAWKEHNEDDPILLYLRAVDLKTKGEVTREVILLKDILKRYPSFISAKKELIKALYEVSLSKAIGEENTEYIKNLACEFLECYVDLLNSDEIEKFKKILGG